jgi:hypothetical protein
MVDSDGFVLVDPWPNPRPLKNLLGCRRLRDIDMRKDLHLSLLEQAQLTQVVHKKKKNSAKTDIRSVRGRTALANSYLMYKNVRHVSQTDVGAKLVHFKT